MGKQSEFILIKTNLQKVTLSTELWNLALYDSYFLNISCTFIFLMQRMKKFSTCFKDRSRHSVWNHVIICFFFIFYFLLLFFFYSIHISLWNHGRDVRAEYIQQMLKEKEGSIFVFLISKRTNRILTLLTFPNFPILLVNVILLF